MKHLLIAALLLSALPVAAQSYRSLTAAPLPENEQRQVIAASEPLLAAAIDLRPDGKALTTHRIGDFTTRIELAGVTIRQVVPTSLTDEDRQQGVSRRYQVKIECQAHRIWDGPRETWSEWRKSGYGFFPTTVDVIEREGELMASARRINDFSPNLDGVMTASLR
jgi:hypothetical protein